MLKKYQLPKLADWELVYRGSHMALYVKFSNKFCAPLLGLSWKTEKYRNVELRLDWVNQVSADSWVVGLVGWAKGRGTVGPNLIF